VSSQSSAYHQFSALATDDEFQNVRLDALDKHGSAFVGGIGELVKRTKKPRCNGLAGLSIW
jgi:hypothetical protein